MAGTGLFSLALREQGYRVLASDVMTYSYHHLIVNLKLNDSPSFSGLKNVIGTHCTYEGVINYLNNIEPQNGFLLENFLLEECLRQVVVPGCILPKKMRQK